MIKYPARIKRNRKRRKTSSLKNRGRAPRTQEPALRRKVVITVSTAVNLLHIKTAVQAQQMSM